MVMGQRFHRGFTAEQKMESWNCWKCGEMVVKGDRDRYEAFGGLVRCWINSGKHNARVELFRFLPQLNCREHCSLRSSTSFQGCSWVEIARQQGRTGHTFSWIGIQEV